MSETTEFKDVYEAIASVSPNRQNILYTVLEEDAFGENAFFSDDKLVWESTKGGFFSQNQERAVLMHLQLAVEEFFHIAGDQVALIPEIGEVFLIFPVPV